MSTQNDAIKAGAALSDEPESFDLHGLFLQHAAAGYTRELTLRAHQMQDITRNLRGITACTAVLIAGDDDDELHLGNWLRSGLVEAIYALAWNTTIDINRINERAKKEGGAV